MKYKRYYQVVKRFPGMMAEGWVFMSVNGGDYLEAVDRLDGKEYKYSLKWLISEGYVKRVYIHGRKK